MYPELLLNEHSLGDLKQGGYISVTVNPGEYQLAVRDQHVWKWGIDTFPIGLDLEAQEVRFVKLLSDATIKHSCRPSGAKLVFGWIIPLDWWDICDHVDERIAAFVEVEESTALNELSELKLSK
jgi:hypothetical protein